MHWWVSSGPRCSLRRATKHWTCPQVPSPQSLGGHGVFHTSVLSFKNEIEKKDQELYAALIVHQTKITACLCKCTDIASQVAGPFLG